MTFIVVWYRWTVTKKKKKTKKMSEMAFLRAVTGDRLITA
jgi:hypothetical protein